MRKPYIKQVLDTAVASIPTEAAAILRAIVAPVPRIAAGIKVHSRDYTFVGQTTGHTRRCHLDGCDGRRLDVRWENGKITRPCEDGMEALDDGTMHIL